MWSLCVNDCGWMVTVGSQQVTLLMCQGDLSILITSHQMATEHEAVPLGIRTLKWASPQRLGLLRATVA